ncbi:SDR family NAD(P)-dependent oxidoreductase [Agrobacterium tumefaciens]|uniref:SDR family NAD(P)-dependent oxidoreductase n=1 Tax=Agrobacterium tumefaciens TaxID=358 RepID=UPI00157437F8|nr:SDR family NAD(P)-dependent oxidoreductase [Agrobacterium tumefaciens]NTE53628.1 SDR family NAD(P)-dependent oxidoreductase [Agrobacterium tumefaciens]NTE71709.1 SDR family NAD(P)-dependent oxidoreductase [Agrobacterium tumefaciens]
MTDRKTIAIFGAGTGLGASVARRYGKAGFRVALVARNAQSLGQRIAELSAQDVDATAFPADLNEIDAIPALTREIEQKSGPIHTAIFAPLGNFRMLPAVDLTAASLKELVNILTLAPVEVVRAVLPGMLARGDGAIIVADGLSAVTPMPGMSGPGPAFAATRNYILGLHEEIKGHGIFAGMLHIGAMIDNSTGLRVAAANGLPVDDPRFATINPDVLAEEIWSLATGRSRAESILPAEHAAH